MGSCHFCKKNPKEQLKSCVCRKVSYCSKDCQAKDWKAHKPSCPPFVIKESPGKGRGLFATRKIKEGQIILEEYPLFRLTEAMFPMSLDAFETNHFPNMDEDTRAKILKLKDLAENMKNLDRKTARELVRKDPDLLLYKDAKSGQMNKIFRIIHGTSISICDFPALYSDKEYGLYNNISLINHSCVANAIWSWVMNDFTKQQVRAIMTIEKGEEITVCYRTMTEFTYASRQSRQQQLLEYGAFRCQCSQCSLQGEELEENERIRTELREKEDEIMKLMFNQHLQASEGSDGRRDLKKAMKLSQRRTKLLQKLDLRAGFMYVMMQSYRLLLRPRDWASPVRMIRVSSNRKL